MLGRAACVANWRMEEILCDGADGSIAYCWPVSSECEKSNFDIVEGVCSSGLLFLAKHRHEMIMRPGCCTVAQRVWCQNSTARSVSSQCQCVKSS